VAKTNSTAIVGTLAGSDLLFAFHAMLGD